MIMPKHSTEVVTIGALTGLAEDILTDALNNFARASKSVEWGDNVYLTIITSDVLNLGNEQVGVTYGYCWHSSSAYGIPTGTVKMLCLLMASS